MPRLLIVDPNIQGLQGHFLELAMVISDAASRFGYNPCVATSLDFVNVQSQVEDVQVFPVFSRNKIRRWSLGPHGYSRLKRDLSANPIGGTEIIRFFQRVIDRLHGATPQRVLESTKRELVALFEKFNPASEDQILFSTADDFVLLIVASAMKDLPLLRDCNLSFLWHNPVTTGRACEGFCPGERERQVREQLMECLVSLKDHRIQFFSTTVELKCQYETQIIPERWTAVEYPIRSTFRSRLPYCGGSRPTTRTQSDSGALVDEVSSSRSKPIRFLCGGGQRSEKGVKLLSTLTGAVWNDFLATGRVQLGLQLDDKTAKKLIASLPHCAGQIAAVEWPLDIARSSLNSEEYLQWIRSADVGLFLYDSRRYYARCSGVLIEMLACGKPVIVPAGCWLSRQIATANNDYLRCIESKSCCREKTLLQAVSLKTERANAHSFSLDIECSAQLITFCVENSTEYSYLAIELETESRSGVWNSRWHVLELIDGECRLLLRRKTNDASAAEKSRLRIWSPYGERGLRVSSVSSKEIVDESGMIAASAIGVTFARTEDLPACIDEIVTNYQSYAREMSAFEPEWANKHSGDQFVSKVFRSTLPLVCREQ